MFGDEYRRQVAIEGERSADVERVSSNWHGTTGKHGASRRGLRRFGLAAALALALLGGALLSPAGHAALAQDGTPCCAHHAPVAVGPVDGGKAAVGMLCLPFHCHP